MRKTVGILLFLVLFMPSLICAEDWGVVKQANQLINVRSARSEKSRIVCQVKPGHKVKVDFLEGSWWAAFRISETRRNEEYALGYVYSPLLRPSSKSTMRIWTNQDTRSISK